VSDHSWLFPEERPLVGCWIFTGSSVVAEIIGGAGYDCVMLDTEHGPGGPQDVLGLLQVLEGIAPPVLVRVPWNDPVEIKRILDLGVIGIMIPSVSTGDEARAAVDACRYPPEGTRGMAPGVIRATGYGAETADYVKSVNEKLFIICQIETAEALENLDEILAVEGIDMLFIGPSDLSGSLGYAGQVDHPEVLRRIADVETRAKAAGKYLGAIVTPARGVGDLVAAGYDLILADADLDFLRDGARESLARHRKEIGPS
jgi:2-keto-3-deoxy-L-rhamnonate aldolase RhmA